MAEALSKCRKTQDELRTEVARVNNFVPAETESLETVCPSHRPNLWIYVPGTPVPSNINTYWRHLEIFLGIIFWVGFALGCLFSIIHFVKKFFC